MRRRRTGARLRAFSTGCRTRASRPHLKRAVLVAEDDAFFQHEGIDLEQIRRSIEIDLARGSAMRGASTITQQLAKNLYLSPSRNPLRKLRELLITRRLEAELSKARIFEIYLNVIEWGDGVWGAEAAAQAGKTSAWAPRRLSVPNRPRSWPARILVNPKVLASQAHPNGGGWAATPEGSDHGSRGWKGTVTPPAPDPRSASTRTGALLPRRCVPDGPLPSRRLSDTNRACQHARCRRVNADDQLHGSLDAAHPGQRHPRADAFRHRHGRGAGVRPVRALREPDGPYAACHCLTLPAARCRATIPGAVAKPVE